MKHFTKNDLLICGILFLLGAVVTLAVINEPKKPSAPDHKRILYLRDSLEMEYYKSILEESFFFNHSKIPVNESDTGIQSTR